MGAVLLPVSSPPSPVSPRHPSQSRRAASFLSTSAVTVIIFHLRATSCELSPLAYLVNDLLFFSSASEFVNKPVAVIFSVKISPICHRVPSQAAGPSGLMALVTTPPTSSRQHFGMLMLMICTFTHAGRPLPASLSCSEVRQSSGVHAALITERFT